MKVKKGDRLLYKDQTGKVYEMIIEADCETTINELTKKLFNKFKINCI